VTAEKRESDFNFRSRRGNEADVQANTIFRLLTSAATNQLQFFPFGIGWLQ